ncbi:MAG TPA: hypothetical protein VLH10_21495 [Yinghuangia sp.]|uniref:hypothetical protein n=1 Tax=Yinghuangia sp. YIM S10712 TaxID=3436930 RepID=UPI002C11C7DA|nr:hypothetical protein [Yinghuangia sp.]
MASLLVMTAAVAVLLAVGLRDPAGRADPPPADASRRSPDATADLAQLARTFVGSLAKDHDYVPPAPAQRTAFSAAVGRVFDGSVPTEDLATLGYAATRRVDGATGREFVEVAEPVPTGRGWGVVYVDTSAPIHRVVQVPHPLADLDTELVAVDLFRRLPGAVLLIAGTHRKAGTDGAGDAAHRTDHMFDALAGELTRRRVPAVQIHGFHDDTVPDTDVVVATGRTTPDATAHRTADALEAADLRTCRVWSSDNPACSRLAALTNVQGHTAAEAGLPFLHIELSRTTRDTADSRHRTAAALAEALSPPDTPADKWWPRS